MEVSFTNAGEFSICAYSGCWTGTGAILSTSPFFVLTKENAEWSFEPNRLSNAQNIVIVFDPSDEFAVVKLGGFTNAFICKQGLALVLLILVPPLSNSEEIDLVGDWERCDSDGSRILVRLQPGDFGIRHHFEKDGRLVYSVAFEWKKAGEAHEVTDMIQGNSRPRLRSLVFNFSELKR